MSDVSKPKPMVGVRRQRSIYQVHYGLERRGTEMKPLVLPSYLGVQAFGLQVAGHKKTDDSKYMGLLQCSNGTVLKPILKPSQQREVDFYARLQTAREPDLVALRAFVPTYYGRTHYEYNGHTQEYIVLEDLTQRMLEQCVMDVKIGRRTWDPLATEEKIKSEEGKYALCKQEFGFCIPGYQVHELATGRLRKYGKDHGKKLHGDMVKDAIKKYLNGFGRAICRSLLLQFLSELWRIQKWARRQRRVRLYAASLLLLYDAAKLRACCANDSLPGPLHGRGGSGACGPTPPRCCCCMTLRNYAHVVRTTPSRAHCSKYTVVYIHTHIHTYIQWAWRQRRVRLYAASLLLLYDAAKLRACCANDSLPGPLQSRAKCRPPPTRRNSLPSGGGPLGGQLAPKGPLYKFRPPRPSPSAPHTAPVSSPWTEALDKLTYNHSFEHNYEDKLSKIKVNYRTLLDQLSSDDPNPNPWATVKIIDFAHAFFNEDEELSLDDNFREGIDNLVEIFESFLKEIEEHGV